MAGAGERERTEGLGRLTVTVAIWLVMIFY